MTGSLFLGPELKKIAGLIEARGANDPDAIERTKRLIRIARVDLVILILVVIDMVGEAGFLMEPARGLRRARSGCPDGLPIRRLVNAGLLRVPGDIRAVHMHHVDIETARAVAHEGDPRSVG